MVSRSSRSGVYSGVVSVVRVRNRDVGIEGITTENGEGVGKCCGLVE